MAPSPFARTIEFLPAWDRRSPDPKKNYGIHGAEILFLLKGPDGAVQFRLFTQWQLPEVTREKMHHPYDPIGGDFHWMERPMPADLGYHSPVPRYDGQDILTDECIALDGKPCYYDGSSLNAEPVFERLLREGHDGVWAALEAYYTRTFLKPEEVSA